MTSNRIDKERIISRGQTDAPIDFKPAVSLMERLAYAEGYADGRRDRNMRRIVTYVLFLLAGFGFGIAFQIATKGPC